MLSHCLGIWIEQTPPLDDYPAYGGDKAVSKVYRLAKNRL
jgi:hypothetical protein